MSEEQIEYLSNLYRQAKRADDKYFENPNPRDLADRNFCHNLIIGAVAGIMGFEL